MILNAVIEKDEFGYFSQIPELKGCVTQGNTYEEARKPGSRESRGQALRKPGSGLTFDNNNWAQSKIRVTIQTPTL